MNLLQQFDSIFKRQTRAVAKIVAAEGTGYAAQTAAGNPVRLRGAGYKAGDSVFYERSTGEILETAPQLDLVELEVE